MPAVRKTDRSEPTATPAQWRALAKRVASRELATLPSSLHIDRPKEQNLAWGRVVAWRDSVPEKVLTPTDIDHAVVTNKRVRFVSFTGENAVTHHADFSLDRTSQLTCINKATGVTLVTFHARSNDRKQPRKHVMWVVADDALTNALAAAIFAAKGQT